MISTLIDYVAGIQIDKALSQGRRKFFLGLSLSTNLGLLFAFKYFNFFSDSTRILLSKFAIQLNPITLKVLLPIAISFYTFQSMAYTIDVYRGKIKPERHLGIFAVFIGYFPQMIAGPIEKASFLIPQLRKEHKFEYARAVSGCRLILWGLFLKMVVADTLAITVNLVYGNPSAYSGPYLILATVFFAIQIYCDFNGYVKIARGCARIMGIELSENFRAPYLSKSIGEFWHRWHITLSRWFRDYVYIPLGGSRVSVPRLYINILITFILSGIWHGGDSWNYAIWGALNGVYLIIEIIFKPIISKIKINHYAKRFMGLAWMFILFNIAWVFFRTSNVHDAVYILTHMFTNTGELIVGGVFIFGIIFILFISDLIYTNEKIISYFKQLSKIMIIRWLLYILIIMGIILFGITKQTEFIYFQF